MKKLILCLALVVIAMSVSAQKTTRKERNHISAGNELYNKGKYFEASKEYQQALKINPSSPEARYNIGLTLIRLSAKAGSNNEEETAKVRQQAQEALQAVASLGGEKAGLASKANYNLGNLAFNSQDYKNALELYKQALRLNPDDEAARRNLRITQKKLQQQNKDDKNQQNQQNQDKKNQDQQNKDQQKQNQDQQNQQNQNQNQEKQQQSQQERINPQTANSVLKAMENKENQTRARIGAGKGEKSKGRPTRKNW